MMQTEHNYTPQGWQCPCCQRVFSPTIAMCLYCGPNKRVLTAPSTDMTENEKQTYQTVSVNKNE